MECPCGSGSTYAECCEPVIRNERPAATAEELMRARYTAYTQVEMDFLLESMHPDHREENDPDNTREWAENSQWHGLEILELKDGGPEDETGEVDFVANYTYKEEYTRYHEVGEFAKVDGSWYFIEGRPGVQKPIVRSEPKVGRNDPCSCGSGKKFKRCCGI